ncbi:MAG: hypothetical protein GXY25_10105, partial [Pirellulaceae bacterium]|nr:hypothetical protein [Pirellulaceae bacterium]
ADGSVSYSPDQVNNVSGSYSDRGTGYWKRSDWWSPSSGSGSGGGSGGGSSSSSSSSGDGGGSYSEQVSYPGFFDGAYYGGGPAGAGGGLIEYVGDIFIDGSGGGYCQSSHRQELTLPVTDMRRYLAGSRLCRMVIVNGARRRELQRPGAALATSEQPTLVAESRRL